ncbi:MAG: branched-chain amino acid ABC transporter permease [Anaerolineae bacterium]
MADRTQTLPQTTTALNVHNWRKTVESGLIVGVVSLFIILVGFVSVFAERNIIFNVLSFGQFVTFAAVIIGGYLAGLRSDDEAVGVSGAHGAALGLTAGIMVSTFILLASSTDLSRVLVNATEETLTVIRFGLGAGPGSVVLTTLYMAVAAASALLARVEPHVRRSIIITLVVVLTFGVLEDLIRTLIPRWLARALFAVNGLSLVGTGIMAGITLLGSLAWPTISERTEPVRDWFNEPGREAVKSASTIGMMSILLLAAPWVLGLYLSDVIDNIGLYILMGSGLNIVVGWAGLLDLGQVGFYAIGAYSVALLTSPNSVVAQFLLATFGITLSWWAAVPLAVIFAAMAGVILGIPVLRMRGDYLAIVTLGLSEIIRIFVTSEAFKPILGGPQGILRIPKPSIFGFELDNAQLIYYVVVIGVAITGYVAWRLGESRIGRAWIAMREDQDVAEAMGINIVQYKLLAFAFGALFAGLAGAIFATKLGSVFPGSFQLLISINVLSVIIAGGMGSMPGVCVGALLLVGLPELLREFSEFRQMLYGALLVAMMLLKPDGFIPAPHRRRELQEEENQ